MVALEHLMTFPIFSLVFFTIIIWCSITLISTTRKNLPPSPRKLPIIGNLHQRGAIPHRYLWSLSKRYGQLVLLHFGRVPILVVSSAEAAREILKNQDAVFADKLRLSIPHRLFYGSKDVAFAPYGDYWRQMRSICVVGVMSSKKVQSFHRVRDEETSAMVEKIKRLGSSSTIVNLSNILLSLTNDVLCRTVLGRMYGDRNEGKKLNMFLSELVELLGIPSLRDYIPLLGWIEFINGLDAKVERVAKFFDEFLEGVIQEHRDGKSKHGDNDGDGELDFVDILLESQKQDKSGLPDDTIKALIMDMFGAGTHTTFASLEWTVAELMKNPRTMKTLQSEVRQVAGDKKEIDEDDLEKMPYLKAVMKESLRLHPPFPIILRKSTHDTKVLSYDVSGGTLVAINAWAIARDPSSWEYPHEFRPERFLDSSIGYKGLHFESVPFGGGRRGCPGVGFAMAVYGLGLAKLVHNFDFGLPNGERGEDLDMTETRGISVNKKLPLLVKVNYT